MDNEAIKLADEHWKYIESIRLKELEMEGKMYRDAFVHGYKHGVEAALKEVKRVNK